MRTLFLPALALIVGASLALAPAAWADEKSGAPPLAFSYHDPQATGRLYLYERGSDAATGGQAINVTLWRGNTLYSGSGFLRPIEENMPFATLITFTVQSGSGITLAYRGTMISGITVSASGLFNRPRTPDQTLDWGIVMGVAAAEATLQGVAVEGPIFPHERPGVVNERPLKGAILVIQDLDGKEVARATADRAGRFKLKLSPGAYRVVPLPPTPGALLPRAEPFTLTLAPGELRELKVRYETGIR